MYAETFARNPIGLALVCLAAGCAHGPPAAGNAADEAPAPYTLGRDDVIEVSIYREPELSRTLPVRPDGKISLPIAGELEAAGRTPEQVRADVIERLHAYIQDPTVVSVIVREVHSARFYAVGEVTKPGDYPLRGGMTLLQALALAGGPGEYSARTSVTVVRAGGARLTVGLGELLGGRDYIVLAPGDTLVVP